MFKFWKLAKAFVADFPHAPRDRGPVAQALYAYLAVTQAA